jgi:hypothetical protein
MVHQPTCIVEVIEIVPPEMVPVVAARVAERLAMPVERVQKLIDDRVGPITRPLRPDKADAIAQTFEAAGVVVAIRPSTDEDELDEAPPADEPPVDEPADDTDEPDTAEPAAPAPADPMIERSPRHAAAPDAWQGSLEAELEGVEDHPGYASEDSDAAADALELDAAWSSPAPEQPSPAPRAVPRVDPWPPARSLGRAGPAGRSPAPLRIEPEDDDDDGPQDDGLEARGEIAPRRRPLVVELGESEAGAGAPFTDTASWERTLDESVDGWSLPAHAGGAADDAGSSPAAAGAPDENPSAWDEDTTDEVAPIEFERGAMDAVDSVTPVVRPPAPRSGARERAPVEAAPARPVPVAWRGLGGEESGPARPPDAAIPRRLGTAEAEAFERAQRTTLRRTLMLWALVLAVLLLVAVQLWANARASAGFDQGLHSYRDADFAAARQVWSRLASEGDPNAQFMLGYMSETGLGQPWSARAAASWYRLAADQGHTEAQWRLGSLYDRGLGVAWSVQDARRWWAAAAASGHGEAAYALGRSLFTTPRSPSDLAAARVAFDRAVALGWHEATTYAVVLSGVSGAPNETAIR